MIPGLALFALAQFLTGVNKGYPFPLLSAIEYLILFSVVCIMGIGAGLLLELIRPDPFPLRAMLSISFVSLLLLAVCGLVSWLWDESGVDNPNFEYFIIAGSFLCLALISRFMLGKLAVSSFRPYALFSSFSTIFIIWSLKAPEKAFLAKPFYFWANFYMLVLIAGITYRLRRLIHFSFKAELTLVAALILLIFSSNLFFYRKVMKLHEAAENGSDSAVVVSKKPSILFIVWDTVRQDHMSLYGYSRKTTPFLEELAEQAVVYTRAVTVSPWTPPSHASMFTGLYPRAHGARLFYDPTMVEDSNDLNSLDPDALTQAEILRDAGYVCGMITSNPLLSDRNIHLSKGFDGVVYFPNPFFLDMKYSDLADYLGSHVDSLIPDKYNHYFRSPFLSAKQINSLALKWIDAYGQDSPFFLMLNYMDAHDPYYPPPDMINVFPGYNSGIADRDINILYHEMKIEDRTLKEDVRNHLVSQYDANLLFLDMQLEQLMEQLRSRDLYDNIFIVITSDHGESFGEHAYLKHGDHVYSQLTDIPLVIKHPHSRITGRDEEIIENRELFDIVLDQAGIRLNIDRHPWDAVCERYRGGSGHHRENPDLRAVYFDNYKLISSGQSGLELYDIETDPAEADNIIDSEIIQTGRGQALLRDYLETIPDRLDGREVIRRLSEKEIQDLKALGYIH